MRKNLFIVLVLLLALTLTGYAQTQPADTQQVEEQLQPLLDRQTELYEKVAAAEPDVSPVVDDTYAPETIRALGVLNAQEEEEFNRVYGRITELYAGFDDIEQEWAKNPEDPEAERRMLERVDALNAEADALWAQIIPMAIRLNDARSREHLKAVGLPEAEVATYMDVGSRAYDMRMQADALYEGWGQADEEGRAAIEQQAAVLHEQADTLLDSIPDINQKVAELENDYYYASLTALTPEEREELKQLDKQINALYESMFATASEPNN